MLHKTLGAMASGGMYDQVEGGFFRYATTRQWEIPHYEKMLEDNAELLAVYAEAHRSFPNAGYDRVVRDVIRWMDATLWRDNVSAFAGSQDADEHYYTLDAAERAKHGAPFVDATIYTSWNALAASAYYTASLAVGDGRLSERASAALRSVQERLIRDGSLHHVDGATAPRIPDLLGDIAAWLNALLDGYETGEHSGAPLFAFAAPPRGRDRPAGPRRRGLFEAAGQTQQPRG